MSYTFLKHPYPFPSISIFALVSLPLPYLYSYRPGHPETPLCNHTNPALNCSLQLGPVAVVFPSWWLNTVMSQIGIRKSKGMRMYTTIKGNILQKRIRGIGASRIIKWVMSGSWENMSHKQYKCGKYCGNMVGFVVHFQVLFISIIFQHILWYVIHFHL